MWWKPALSLADVLWSSGFRVMEPSSQTIRVSLRIAALPPSTAPSGPLASPPSRSTPSHRASRAAFGGMFSPAPAVLGVGVCSKTSIDVKAPDSRSARAVISPAMPPPAISARITSPPVALDRRPSTARPAPAVGARRYRTCRGVPQVAQRPASPLGERLHARADRDARQRFGEHLGDPRDLALLDHERGRY